MKILTYFLARIKYLKALSERIAHGKSVYILSRNVNGYEGVYYKQHHNMLVEEYNQKKLFFMAAKKELV